MGRGSRAIVVLAFLLLAPSIHAEEFYGPLRIRDMGPFRLLRLDMMPDHAIKPSASRWAVELHLSHSNTFAMDKDVSTYLKARNRRGEINATDGANIIALSDNAFLFDGSLGLFQAGLHFGLTDRWSVSASIPMLYYGGGFLDSTIEAFHTAFGFDTFGREYISRNDFQAVAVVDGESLVLLDRPIGGGLGDPVFSARYWWPLDARSAMTLEIAHKFATHDGVSFLSTGSDDTGVQLAWNHKGDRNAFYTSFAVVNAGGSNIFPDHVRRVVPALNLAWEHKLTEYSNALVQVNASRSMFRAGEADTELTGNVYQVSAGLRHRAGQWVWSYALTKNVVNFNNTADLGFHIGFAWLSAP